MTSGRAESAARRLLVVGSGDLARATAQVVARSGAEVATTSASGRSSDGDWPCFPLDVTADPVLTEDLRRFVAAGLDAVVLAYGPGLRTTLQETDPVDLSRLLDVYGTGTLKVIQALTNALAKRRGTLLLVSSRIVAAPGQEFAAYGTAKATQEHLVLSAGSPPESSSFRVAVLRAPAVRGALVERLLFPGETGRKFVEPRSVAEAAWAVLECSWTGRTGVVACMNKAGQLTYGSGETTAPTAAGANWPERIAVIGPAGAGKSYAARLLSERTALPLHHLDTLRWTADWQKRPSGEWTAEHGELTRSPRWIIDGNYTSTLAQRLERADLVVFLMTPMLRCVARVISRRYSARHEHQLGLPPGGPIPPLSMPLRKAGPMRRQELAQLGAELKRRPSVPVAFVRSPEDLDGLLESLPSRTSQYL